MLNAPRHTTWSKICGITTVEDLRLCEQHGADAVGFNCYAKSPRYISPAQVTALSQATSLAKVALFVDPTADEVEQIVRAADIDLLQFHGNEDETFCAGFGLPYMKVLRMRPDIDVAALAQQFQSCWALLLDTFVPGQPGGTGETFDWQQWPANLQVRLVLAGGLSADNVAAAIRTLHPYGVDVCGGVEGESKGLKDPIKVAKFLQEVGSVSGE